MAGKKEKTLEEAFAQLEEMLEKLADKDVPLRNPSRFTQRVRSF